MAQLKILVQLIMNYRFTGLLVWLKIQFGLINKIWLPNIKSPIYLRKNTTDIHVFYQIFISKEYEIDMIFKPETIIDAGSNIGLAAIYFANRYPNSTIFAIEPERSNFELLKKNTEQYPNIVLINKALSNKREKLNVLDTGFGEWQFVMDNIENKENHGNTIHQINTITMEDIMIKHQLQSLDIVKIDIEGYEKELFESQHKNWIPKAKCLIIELHDRIKHGCSKQFFKTISKYDFSFSQSGENLVFMNKNF